MTYRIFKIKSFFSLTEMKSQGFCRLNAQIQG